MKICQRCDVERDDWTMTEGRFSVAGVEWRLLLCRECATTVQEVLRTSLRSFQTSTFQRGESSTIGWGDKREKSD